MTTMTRSDAARLLGVDTDATDAAVQAAYATLVQMADDDERQALAAAAALLVSGDVLIDVDDRSGPHGLLEVPVVIGAPSAADGHGDKGRVGVQGERRTAMDLAALQLPPDAVVLHDLKIPGRNANIDHVVVIGNLVVVLDTKVWGRGRYFWRADVGCWRDGSQFTPGNLDSTTWATQWLANHLSGVEKLTRGWRRVLVVDSYDGTGDGVDLAGYQPDGYDVIAAHQLADYFADLRAELGDDYDIPANPAAVRLLHDLVSSPRTIVDGWPNPTNRDVAAVAASLPRYLRKVGGRLWTTLAGLVLVAGVIAATPAGNDHAPSWMTAAAVGLAAILVVDGRLRPGWQFERAWVALTGRRYNRGLGVWWLAVIWMASSALTGSPGTADLKSAFIVGAVVLTIRFLLLWTIPVRLICAGRHRTKVAQAAGLWINSAGIAWEADTSFLNT